MEALVEQLSRIDFNALYQKVLDFVHEYAATPENLLQLTWITLSFILGYVVSRPFNRWIKEYTSAPSTARWLASILEATRKVVIHVFSFLFLLIFIGVALHQGWQQSIVSIALNLLGAWIIIRFFTYFIRRPALAKWFALIAWSIAAINILGYLGPITDQLNNIAFHIGENRISLTTLLQGVISFALLLWFAVLLSRVLERQIKSVSDFTPSLKVLLSKIVKITLITLAFLIGLNSIGIDLTALAVFGGAVGVGVGFGLQKVVSNFISGIILLVDRSIKPGDVIRIEDTYGWVNSLSSRHISVITRDGKEHLIPNELLITEKVENWSYSDDNVRLRIPVSVSYQSDLRQALVLMMEAANEESRVIEKPQPNALVIGFGDSAVNLELRAWINDPYNGMRNITSALLLRIWDKFKENDIEIPFPQRDMHIKSVSDEVEKLLGVKAPAKKTTQKKSIKKA